MVEKSDVVEECSSCVRLKQEIEIAQKDQAATLKMIKEKIMSTDKLIKKYQKKCDDFDKQAKVLNDLTTKHKNCERNTEILQEQLKQSLEVTEPQKKTIKRLIQEKFIAEETIQELKQKNIDQEEVINQLKHGLQLRDEKDSSWKLEQQLQAKQIEKEKKRVEKLMKDLEKAKEEIKRGRGLVREKSRELRAVGRKCDNFEFQLNKLKEEVKCGKKDGNDGFFNHPKRRLSPKECNRVRRPQQSAKRCEEKLTELLSDSTKECNSPTGKKPPLTSIFDEMTKLAVYPLSPVPPSPTESKDSSNEFSDDNSSGSSSDSEGGSLVDLGEMLELKLENKDATSGEAGTADNLNNMDEQELGCLESGDEDVENEIKSFSDATNDNNYEKNKQITPKESDKESMTDNYLNKGQRTPEKRQSERHVTKASALEDSDTEYESPLSSKHSAIISSEELISVATSKVSSKLSTWDLTTKNVDTDENRDGTISIDKTSCVGFDKETIEEVDIKNNNSSLSGLNKDLKDISSVVNEKENDHIKRNDKLTCSEKNKMSTTNVADEARTESAQWEDSAIIDNTCGAENETGHTSVKKTAIDELLSEKHVKSFDLDNSETEDVFAIPPEFRDGDDEFADRTSRVLPGLDDDEEHHTKDTPITQNIQHTENDTPLLTDDKNTTKYTEYANKLMENELEADSELSLRKLKDIGRSDVPRKCSLNEFDDRDDTLLNKSKIIKDSLKKYGERLGNTTLPEQQEREMEGGVGNKLSENEGIMGKNLDTIGDAKRSFPKGDTEQIALNVTVEKSRKIRTHKKTMNTKCREEPSTSSGNDEESEKANLLTIDGDKVLGIKEEQLVHKNVQGTKRSNIELCDTRKGHKRVAFPEEVAPTHVNSTPAERIERTFEGTKKQSDSNLSTAETSGNDNDTVSARIINCDSIRSNDIIVSKNDAKSSVADDYVMKCHLDSFGESSELLTKEENVAVEKSSCKTTVDNIAVPHHGDSMNSFNKVEADSKCCGEASMDKSATIMNESTEEVLEEGQTNPVVDTNTSVVTIEDVNINNHDALGLGNDSGKTIMEFEALTSDDAADSNLMNKNNPKDESHQDDFTAIKESILIDTCETKSSIPVPSNLPLSIVINDCLSVFDEEMPILSPLPSSPSSSRESSPTRELDMEEKCTLAHFTSLPSRYAASKPTVDMRSLASARVKISPTSSVSQASLTATTEHKDLEPSLKLEPPRQDASDAEGHDKEEKVSLKKQKKKGNVQLSVRPYFLSEIQYADKVMRFLTREHVKIEDVVSRLSNPKTMSNGTPLAAALVKFQHNEDLMPIIIQKYYDRDRQHQEQVSRLPDLNNWTPILSVFEERVFVMVTRLSESVDHLKGLSTKVISLLSRCIVHSCTVTEEPDKRCVASNCRLLCALCRKESNLQHMRVLCYDIIRSLYSRPGTILYLMISIAAVWPPVLAASVLTISRGVVCVAGRSYQPLPCTIQMILTTWARSNDWVLLGNVLDWLCAWKQVPSGVLSLQQLAGELVKLMKDPTSAQLMQDKDGNPILGFRLYEVVKALELVTCVLGWTWLNNVLVRGYLWDILAYWVVTSTEPETSCTDSNVGSCNDGSKDPSNDSSLSTSVMQVTNHAADTSNSTDTNQVLEPTVVAAIRLLGLACRIAIQHYQTIPQVIPLLVGLLQTAQDCSVPYAVQLASAYSLLEVSPWQPNRVVSVLDEWKIVQEKNNTLPGSLIQGVNSLKVCLQPSRDSSLLFENCAKIENNEDGDIESVHMES